MKKTLFILFLFALNSCKTTQQGFFLSHSEAANLTAKPSENKHFYASLETKNTVYFQPHFDEKKKGFLHQNIENIPIVFIGKTTFIHPTKHSQFRNKKEFRQKVFASLSKEISKEVSVKNKANRTLSRLYVSLSLVLASIAAMVFLGNVGAFTIIFGFVTLVLAFFFGMQSINKIKKGKSKIS